MNCSMESLRALSKLINLHTVNGKPKEQDIRVVFWETKDDKRDVLRASFFFRDLLPSIKVERVLHLWHETNEDGEETEFLALVETKKEKEEKRRR